MSWLQADTFDQSVIAQSLVMGIIFLSFVVVTGLGGMVSLAQAAFVTAGGFAAGWALTWDTGLDIPGISTHGQINFLWAAIFGGAHRRRARRADRGARDTARRRHACPGNPRGRVHLRVDRRSRSTPFETTATSAGPSGRPHSTSQA